MLYSQKMIIVERPGTVKNFKYKKGNKIFLKKIDEEKLSGRISKITDTSFFINKNIEVKLSEITIVFKPRGFLYRSYIQIRFAGYAFLSLNTFNRLVHNEKPVFDNSGLIAGFSTIGISYAMQAFAFRKLKVGEKWRIKIIDL